LNKDAWNELSPDLQKTVLATARNGAHYCAGLQEQSQKTEATDLRAKSVTFTELSTADRAQLRQLSSPLVDAWAKTASPDGVRLLATVQKLVQQSGK
jgi:TRAP-type C4-dicarboxylate transport system substrate-binding protein